MLPYAVTEAAFRAALPKPTSSGILGFGAAPAADADILRAVEPFYVPPGAQLFKTTSPAAQSSPVMASEAATAGCLAPAQAPQEAPCPAAATAHKGAAGDTADLGVEQLVDGRPLVVLYCTIGARSGLACGGLSSALPPLRVANLAGSLITWTHSGGLLFASAGEGVGEGLQPVHILHSYGEKWALQPAGVHAVW